MIKLARNNLVSVFTAAFFALTLFFAFMSVGNVSAIECNGTPTTEDCLQVDIGAPVTGNYQTAVAAIGMYPQEATETITLNIPNCAASTPTIFRATAYWAMRDFDDLNYWDESVDIAQDANPAVTINSDRRYKANMGGGAGSSYVADITSSGLVATGSHTYTITNFTTSPGSVNVNTSVWGFGIHVIYECPEFATRTIQQTEGHDIHWYGWTNGWDSDRSELMCEQVTASILPRVIDLEFFLPGSVDPSVRQADMWYKTGTGTAPGPTDYDLLTDVNTPANGGMVLDRLLFSGEPELEVYTNTMTVPAGDEYFCIQTDSSFTAGTHPDDVSAYGASMYAGLGFWSYEPATTVSLSLGDLVWEDTDNNGVVNGSEAGICGVDVHLYVDSGSDGAYDSGVEGTTPLQSTTTACAGTVGEYTFTGLAADDYCVVIPQIEFNSGGTLENYTSSTGGSGTYEPAPDPDNDVNDDDNGTMQAGDGAVSCAVTLSDDGEPINDGDTDNDTNLSVDFGFFMPANLSLGNLVWEDADNNGVVNGSEAGICGVSVHLYIDVNSDGKYTSAAEGTSPMQSTTTACGANDGEYLFTMLDEGDYVVVIPASEFASGQVLASYVSSTGTNGSPTGTYEPAPDPDNDVNNDDNGFMQGVDGAVTCTVTLTDNGEPTTDGDSDNDTNLSVDFGFFNDAKLGDYVWYDLNNNGLQEDGESGVENVTATLYNNADDSVVATLVTDSNGAYQFCYLIPGTYYVEFSNLPADYNLVSSDSGDDAADSDADPTTARTGTYVLAAGDEINTVDGGIYAVLAATGLDITKTSAIGAVGLISTAVAAQTKRRYSRNFSRK